MEEQVLQANFKEVDYHPDNGNILTIRFHDTAVDMSSHYWTHRSGGFGDVSFWNVPLDEIINLRDRLTKIIDTEISKINAKKIETELYKFEYVADDVEHSKHTVDIQATSLTDAIAHFRNSCTWLSYQVVNKEYIIS